jgi:DNA topoisomerase-1
MTNLIIVESPTKARTLGRFLGSGYTLTATMGHVRDLPEKELGIDIEHDFTPKYVLIGKKRDGLNEIKRLAAGAQMIYLATDPDREGEAIAWHVSEILGKISEVKSQQSKVNSQKGKFYRIVFHEITPSAISEALIHPRDIDLPLVNAQQARRVLDRLVGYKLSPLLWKKVKKGLSAGRVQSVAVRLIVEKEREITAFVPREYWEIYVELAKVGEERNSFLAKLVELNGQKIALGKKEEVDPVVTGLEAASYSVSGVEKREVLKFPSAPFTTSTLQQTAANRFGWSAKRTMQLAQDLYEQGLITYHRTDSTNLAEMAIAMVRDYIGNNFERKYLPETPRLYKTKSKVAQEAHEAIRPTDIKVISAAELLGREESRLYELVWKRFVASQMTPAVYDETSARISGIIEGGNTYGLEAKGSRLQFDGWMKLYEKLGKDEEEELENNLPEILQGETLQKLGIKPEQKFTQPPARYTEATLIKKLEELGIGRPSTYAPILTTIQDRQYVEKVDPKTGLPPGKALKPTNLGMTVNDFLVQHFSDIVDYQFTAKMEDELDDIANGQKQWIPVIREFYGPFSEKLGKATDVSKVKVELEEVGESCPECKEGRLVIRLGKFGKFISCNRFPNCKFRAPYVPKVEGLKCPDDGGDVVLRKTRSGKTFYGCINWPTCKWASWTRPKAAAESDSAEPKTAINI